MIDENNQITEVVEPTELGESLRELNNDSIQRETNMSAIDMRTRLSAFEIGSILALDTLVAMRILPVSCLAFTRQKKRLNVSLKGEGRTEIVDIVSGKRMNDTLRGGGGMFDFQNKK